LTRAVSSLLSKTFIRVYRITDALDVVKNLCGRTPDNDFAPKRLKNVRAKMFRWATEEELLDAHVYHALQAVRRRRFGLAIDNSKGEEFDLRYLLRLALGHE
jgi:hypothetical protein